MDTMDMVMIVVGIGSVAGLVMALVVHSLMNDDGKY